MAIRKAFIDLNLRAWDAFPYNPVDLYVPLSRKGFDPDLTAHLKLAQEAVKL